MEYRGVLGLVHTLVCIEFKPVRVVTEADR